ncbi:hypothetical protein B0A50_00314 [Salinomyces thailandicus]|uniref:Uncharacterized protein n=1 Tax=Salinomyces thailandicus TaxID=706561 RepID=A0A4U0UFL3_9PEZI|nr:hypothetical protein B0A50_00314 [Salinomyces thailandica]
MSSSTDPSPAILIRVHEAPTGSNEKRTLEFSNIITIPQHLWAGLSFHTSDISSLLGMPLKLGRYPDDNNHISQRAILPFFLEIDPEDTAKFGKVKLDGIQGTVIVARSDGGEVDRKKLQDMVTYFGGPILQAIKEYRALEPGSEEKRKRAREIKDGLLTREAFERWVTKGGRAFDKR